jgi:hypothetical protein
LVVVIKLFKSTSSIGAKWSYFFLCSSIDTPPGPRLTIINSPPMTDSVWKKSYLRKSRSGLYDGIVHHEL